MRIIIDMQGAQSESRFRGIGRYSMSLSLAIARNAGDHDVWLVLSAAFPESIPAIRDEFKGLISDTNIRVFEIPLPTRECEIGNLKRTRAAELLREDFLQKLNPDVVLVSSLFDDGYFHNAVASIGRLPATYKTVAIQYDLIPYLNPKGYLSNQKHSDYYMRRIESLKKADLLLSISKASQEECREALNIDKSKICNISTAIDDMFKVTNISKLRKQELFGKYGITRNVILYAPGGFDIRKNFKGIIEAYSLLSKDLKQSHQLIIVSKIQDAHRVELELLSTKMGLTTDDLIITGYVPENDLISFYCLAALFVFPSKHEGFGLPVLEAMSCGAPVIGSNTTSIPEVIGLSEALFDPDSSVSISNKIKEVLENSDFRAALVNHSLKQSKLFSWDRCANTALRNMEKFDFDMSLNDSGEGNNIIESIATLYSEVQVVDYDLALISKSLDFNTKRSKNLFLDISVIVHGDAKSGIQRVVRNLLTEIYLNASLAYKIKPIYFDGCCYRHGNNFVESFFNKSKGKSIDGVTDFQQDDIYLSLDLNADISSRVKNLHIYLRQIGMKLYFIVYDILIIHHPEWWKQNVSSDFQVWLQNIVETSSGLICISRSVANEVEEWMNQNPPKRLSLPKVTSFHLGADLEDSSPLLEFQTNSELVLTHLMSRPSFLMVGTIEPRKGHKQTLEAFEKLWKNGVDIILVIAGKEGWLVDTLVDNLRKHPELNKRLFWLEGISDEYLEQVYGASACLIAASEGEGFGLPLIEAAQYKIPIIARDIPVFKEVAGEFAYFFEDNKDLNVIASSIKKWLELYKQDKHPKSNDMPWLTWKESAKQLLGCLKVQ